MDDRGTQVPQDRAKTVSSSWRKPRKPGANQCFKTALGSATPSERFRERVEEGVYRGVLWEYRGSTDTPLAAAQCDRERRVSGWEKSNFYALGARA